MAFAILASLKKHCIADCGIPLANPGILFIDSRSSFCNEDKERP